MWMQLEINTLSEVSQKEKDKYHISYYLYVESKIWRKCTYLPNRNRLTDMEKRLVVAKREGWGGGYGMDQKSEVSSCTLLHLGWISNEVLPYSTRNLYTITWDRPWWKIIFTKRVYVCVCVYHYIVSHYNRHGPNIVNQQYFNKNIFKIVQNFKWIALNQKLCASREETLPGLFSYPYLSHSFILWLQLICGSY